MSLISSQLAEFNKAIDVLRQAMSKQSADMEANVKRLERQIQEHAAASRNISSQLQESMRKADTVSPHALRSEMNNLTKEVSRLSATVKNSSYATPGWKGKLRQKFSSLSRWLS